MKNHQLEAFYQVMLTGSISQAARNLLRTQPAVSMTISSLEDTLRTQLFDRTNGRIRPRAEAMVLFERIRPVMEQLQDIQNSFSRLDGIGLPQVSIVSSNNVGVHLIPNCLRPLASPRTGVRLMDGAAARILSDMEAQLLDIAVSDEGLREAPEESPLYTFETFHVPMYGLFRRGLIANLGDRLTVEELKKFPVLSLYSEHQVARKVSHLVSSPVFEFQNFFPMACHALASDSIALVDSITCAAITGLTGETLQPDWRPLEGTIETVYYLIRPTFRMRSEASDACYEAIRNGLLRHVRT